MTALVDLAIAMLVATGFATLLVKLPMAIQSWFRQFAGVFFFAILTVTNVFGGTGRDEVRLKVTTTRDVFLLVWFAGGPNEALLTTPGFLFRLRFSTPQRLLGRRPIVRVSIEQSVYHRSRVLQNILLLVGRHQHAIETEGGQGAEMWS